MRGIIIILTVFLVVSVVLQRKTLERYEALQGMCVGVDIQAALDSGGLRIDN